MDMPYKDKAVANARARQLRRDPQKGEALRSYHREYQRAYRLLKLEEMRKYQREWKRTQRRKLRGENFGKRRRKKTDAQKRATLLAKKKRWYAKHKEKWNAKRRLQRLADPAHYSALDRARYLRDSEKRIHASRVQRAKRTGQDCYISVSDWLSLLRKFEFRCAYCKLLLTEANRSLDHKIPLIRGGTNDIENLVPACRRCNQRKNRMTDAEFIEVLKITSTFQ